MKRNNLIMETHSSKIELEITKEPLPSGHVNVGYDSGESKRDPRSKAQWPSTESEPPAYNEAVREEGDGMDIEAAGEESHDDKILAVLRDIVKKCTNVNPAKRPTAKEVLEMLEEVAPPEYFKDDFENSDDDDDDFDDLKLEKKLSRRTTKGK